MHLYAYKKMDADICAIGRKIKKNKKKIKVFKVCFFLLTIRFKFVIMYEPILKIRSRCGAIGDVAEAPPVAEEARQKEWQQLGCFEPSEKEP